MIRFHLQRLIADHEFKNDKKLTIERLSREVGIHRTTLTKIIGKKGYNTTTNNIDVLCRFFNCQISDLIEYIPDDELGNIGP